MLQMYVNKTIISQGQALMDLLHVTNLFLHVKHVPASTLNQVSVLTLMENVLVKVVGSFMVTSVQTTTAHALTGATGVVVDIVTMGLTDAAVN